MADLTLYWMTRKVMHLRSHHSWASELMFAPGDDGAETRHVNSIWPIWNVLDMTPGGRGGEGDFPRLDYG